MTKIIAVFLLVLCLASCAWTYVSDGVDKKQEGSYAILLTGDKKNNDEGLGSIFYITHVNGHSSDNPMAAPRWPRKALLKPGVNNINVMYPYSLISNYHACLRINVKAGLTYRLQGKRSEDKMLFWIVNDQDKQPVSPCHT